MKKIVIMLIGLVMFLSCEKEEEINVSKPSNISDVLVEPRVGGAFIEWEVPADSNFTYIELKYTKNGKEVIEQISKFTDTVIIGGLIHAEEFVFQLQTVNESPTDIAKGKIFTTEAVRPIARDPEITYFPDELTAIQVEITPDMLDTYTQEVSEGPKENLIDGDPATYWHSAWSSNTKPLPHWIQINFEAPQELGAIKYWTRKNAGAAGYPTQFALATSADGTNWEIVWESQPKLPYDDDVEHVLPFDKNYESQYFRIMILANPGGTSFTHLGEINFFTMKVAVVDKEKEAEEEYYNY